MRLLVSQGINFRPPAVSEISVICPGVTGSGESFIFRRCRPEIYMTTESVETNDII
jgi:hypothetical protein